MSLTGTPAAERVHIAFFGRRNAGKSSVINAVTQQKISIVSDVAGTTTDPVSKTMELFPLGPCVIYDTAGIDDTGKLGSMRVERTYAVLDKTDIAVIVVDAATGLTDCEHSLIKRVEDKKLPYIICYNKTDITPYTPQKPNEIAVSAVTGEGINDLRIMLGHMVQDEPKKYILTDIVRPGATVILVIPIDTSAPKGRLILPQQQVIRELLENSNITICVTDTELPDAIAKYGDRTSLVITDSQAFAQVGKIVPESIPLTSFSILFMRYKGELDVAVKGAYAIDKLQDGDRVLISEGCTHHKMCDDIGSVKIPRLIEKYAGKKVTFAHTQGTGFETDLSKYKLIIHCGACMLNEKEVKSRIARAIDAGIPFTNYGIAISYMTGILDRAVKPLGYEVSR